MNIYLIEDNKAYARKLRSCIEKFTAGKAIWSSSNILHIEKNYLEFIEKKKFDSFEKAIYVFDIELENVEETGLSLAQKLRTFDFDSYIIFVTSHIEMTAMTYQFNLKALNFIYKGNPNFELLLTQAFEQIDLELRHRSRCETPNEDIEENVPRLKYAYQSNYYNLKLDDILYVETHGLKRQLIIHTMEDTFIHPGPLKALKKDLGVHFIQTHRTTLAQARYIEHIELENGRHMAYFSKQKKCMISKSYLKDVTEAMGLFQN